jgi:hypothetical protein
MLLGGPQNTIKSHLVFTALFCFAPFSVFFSRMSAPHSHSVSHLSEIVVRHPGQLEKLCGVHCADLVLLPGVEALIINLILVQIRAGNLK